MTLLLLIRHGENDFMRRHLTGRTAGISLNARGQQQAQMLAEALNQVPITAIYSSPLERAVETAQPVAITHGLEVQIRPGLVEVDYGRFQGRTYKQVKRTNLWKAMLESPSSIQFPNGETFAEVQQRVVAELETLVHEWQPPDKLDAPAASEKREDPVIAVFAHADVVRLALAHFLNMPLDDFFRLQVGPASISIVHTDGKSLPRVICINQAANFQWPEPEKRKERKKQTQE